MIILPLIVIIAGFASADQWTYEHIEKWPGDCNTGKFQSPIDLDASVATEKAFTPFQFRNYNLSFAANMKNNQHSVEVRLLPTDKKPSIIGGSLPSEFILDHLHFHWGSEHTMNGHRYPLEVHLVHYDSRLGSVSDAAKHKGGLAVLGVFFALSPDDVDDIEPLVELIDNIGKYPNKLVDLQEKISPKTFLPCDKAGFYRYSGSLTTPACNEVVTWTIFTNPLTLSTHQVKLFETIQTDHGALLHNFRPIQKLNDRPLYLKRSPLNAAEISKKPFTKIVAFFVLMLLIAFN